jgi:hypothetical protein
MTAQEVTRVALGMSIDTAAVCDRIVPEELKALATNGERIETVTRFFNP